MVDVEDIMGKPLKDVLVTVCREVEKHPDVLVVEKPFHFDDHFDLIIDGKCDTPVMTPIYC